MSHVNDPNPYQSPAAPDSAPGRGEPSQRTAQLLAETRPWVKLFGVLLYLSIGMMILAGIFMLLGGLGPGGPVEGAILGLVYILMALLYFFPARFLMKYASGIDAFVKHGGTDRLDNALESQKSFWKFVGILAAVILAVYAVIFVFGIIGALMSASAVQ